jgi:hypothetical protein
MILAGKRGSGEITQIKRFHLGGANMSIFQALLTRFDGQRTQIAVGKSPKTSFSRGDHGHRSHIISLARKLVSTFPRR